MDYFPIRVTLIGALLLIIPTTVPVHGEFVLTVNFINYTNPTGLCAECNDTRLQNVTSADQLVPVCCDESPFTSVNCDNTGEARCDTRFRWTIRPFGASLETRPASVPDAATPPYYFTDCPSSSTTCPFSEMSTTFSQGPTGFLGVAANPLPVVPRTNMPWTGRVQFFIEALDSGLPNIIDSLLINLNNLQLGADFTEEMTFTGYHNISHMTMSFRVACKTGFCGRDCTTTRLNNPRIQSCNFTSNGEIVCTDSRYDPSADCNSCLHNLDISTDCSTCLMSNFDPDTNCTACLPGYDITTNCTAYLPGYDITTNCSMCLIINYDPSTNCTTCVHGPRYDFDSYCIMCLDSRFDPGNNCTSCLLEGYDPLTNCTQCLPNRDLSTNCTQCSPGWDISSDCMSCSDRRYDSSVNCTSCLYDLNISTNCSTCLVPNFDSDTNCTACLPGYDITTNCSVCLIINYDPSTNCTTCVQGSQYDFDSNCIMCLDSRFDPDSDCTSCLLGGYDPLTNCTQCLPNRDLSTNCTQCSPGWDISSDCMSCLAHRDPSTNCTQCLPNRDLSTDCMSCSDRRYDSSANCTSCLYNMNISTNCSTCLVPNFDSDTNCTACLPGYDITTNCSMCLNTNYDPSTNCTMCSDSRFAPDSDCTSCLLGGYDPLTNCTQCLPNRDLSTNCTQCSPGWDISSDCMGCLPRRDPSTNCAQCLPNHDPSTDCSTCLFGFDISRDCLVCLPGRDISTNCTTCLSGYTRENCVLETSPSPSLDMALMGGIAGGVGGSLLLVIIVLVVVVCMLVYKVRRSGHAKLNVSDGGPLSNAYELNNGGTGTGLSVEHNFQNPIYGPGEELGSKTGTGTSQDRVFTNSLYESTKIQGDEDYSQLRHPSTSPLTHQVKTGTNDFTSPLGGPVYDSANYQDGSEPKEGTPVYNTADHSLGNNSPFSKEIIPPQDDYDQLHHSTEARIPLQPVPPTPLEPYDTTIFTDEIEPPVCDEAHLPPPTVSGPEKKTKHPSKCGAAYERIDDDVIVPSGTASSGVYDKAHHTPSPPKDDPLGNDYSKLEGPTNVYSALEEPSNVYSAIEEPASAYSAVEEPANDYSALEGPTEDYSVLKHPAKAITKSEGVQRPVNNYSKLNGNPDEELPIYDVTSHHHPQTQPQTLPAHQAALYDTANYPNEPSQQHHDYIKTADFLGLPTDSSPPSSVKPRPYDYVDTPLDGRAVPPAVDPQVRPVYTNTVPGKITPEAESHYDLGL